MPADTIGAMVRRLIVVASLLSLVAGVVWMPHEHVHRDSGVRHAHLDAHHDQASAAIHDGRGRQPRHGHEGAADIMKATMALSPATAPMAAPVPAVVPTAAAFDPRPQRAERVDPDRPRAHGPPSAVSLRLRAPPAF
jgi:hypothetical protein